MSCCSVSFHGGLVPAAEYVPAAMVIHQVKVAGLHASLLFLLASACPGHFFVALCSGVASAGRTGMFEPLYSHLLLVVPTTSPNLMDSSGGLTYTVSALPQAS